jgi:hypothetical protein
LKQPAVPHFQRLNARITIFNKKSRFEENYYEPTRR